MNAELIHDRGRGPEIRGTRITVYNLMPYLLDPTMTEDRICAFYELTPEQVAAARAYVLNNADTVLAEHVKIEERIANRSDVLDSEKAQREKITFLKFKEWLAKHEAAATDHTDDPDTNANEGGFAQFPTFWQWFREQESRSDTRS